MIFTNKYESSFLPKGIISIIFLSSILLSYHIMFTEEAHLISWLAPYKANGLVTRKILLLSCFCIYFLRILGTLFIFYRRKMYWTEALVIMNIMPWIFPYVAFIGGNQNSPLGAMDFIGLSLFLLGSYLNTKSEYSRHVWKKNMENKGQLYTQGLFKYARNINYLGDVILFTGLVIIAANPILLLVPISMGLFFIGYLIPSKEKYMKHKYGTAFDEYARITKALIPMIY